MFSCIHAGCQIHTYLKKVYRLIAGEQFMSCMSLVHEEMWPQLLRSRENHQSHAIVMLQELLFFTSSLVLMEEIRLTTLGCMKKTCK